MAVSYEEKKRSGASKFLMGCGIGCGVLILLVIAAGIGLYYWVKSTRPITPAEQIIPSSIEGFAVVRIEPDDRGLQQALAQAMISNMRAQGQEVPKQLTDIEQGGAGMEGLKQIFPAQLIMFVRGEEGSEKLHESYIFSIHGLWRPIRMYFNLMFMSEKGKQPGAVVLSSYKNVKIGEITGVDKGKGWVGVVENNLLWCGSEEDAKLAVDRLLAPSEVVLPAPIASLYEKVEKDQDVVFVGLNTKNYIQERLKPLVEEMNKSLGVQGKVDLPLDKSALAGVAGHVDLTSADEVKMHIIFRFTAAATAARAGEQLTQISDALREKYPDVKELAIQTTDTDIVVDVTLTGLRKQIDSYVQEMVRKPQ